MTRKQRHETGHFDAAGKPLIQAANSLCCLWMEDYQDVQEVQEVIEVRQHPASAKLSQLLPQRKTLLLGYTEKMSETIVQDDS